MRTYCVFYRSFYESISELPETNQLEIYRAIFELSLNENRIELTGINKTIFTLIEPQIIANIQRFKNGSKPKEKRNGSETEAKQKQSKSETEANKNKNKNKNENKNENEKENKKEKKNFEPPTLDDVKNWFVEQGSTAEQGTKAWNYYNEGNWIDAKGQPVKNWRQKMRGGRWLEVQAQTKQNEGQQYQNLTHEPNYQNLTEFNNFFTSE
jgi:DNA polymerase III gamma/tau subunit